jgi:hypothetical protein
LTPVDRDVDHPFLGSQRLHTITIGSPAFYSARKPRRLRQCESSGGSRHDGSPSLSLKGSFFVNSVFLQDMPYTHTQPSGQSDDCGVRTLTALVVLELNSAMRRGGDRSPDHFHPSPSQPFTAKGEQSIMKVVASGGIRRRD